jgi:hypothetical protein
MAAAAAVVRLAQRNNGDVGRPPSLPSCYRRVTRGLICVSRCPESGPAAEVGV